jgi:hypothetical protein
VGYARNAPVYLKPEDTAAIKIENITVLKNQNIKDASAR